jgi:tetratricopeptide (TPR) repeat protein
MNPAPTIVLAILAAAGTSFAVVQLQGPVAPPVAPEVSASALQQKIEQLRADVEALRQRPAAEVATADSPVQRTVVPTITDEQVAAAVEHYLAEGRGALPADAAANATTAIDTETALAKLRQHASFWNNGDLYKKVFAAGKMDELIASFEELAAANPKDPQAQMDLANAYLAYLQMDNSKYPLSMKADEAFDRVLALDEHHWEARFSKAVSYTFWPEFLGKKKDAIANFERLVDQQDSMPVADYQAQTYLYLGNLLSERDPERARAVWQRGLRRHPGNAELAKKLNQ